MKGMAIPACAVSQYCCNRACSDEGHGVLLVHSLTIAAVQFLTVAATGHVLMKGMANPACAVSQYCCNRACIDEGHGYPFMCSFSILLQQGMYQ